MSHNAKAIDPAVKKSSGEVVATVAKLALDLRLAAAALTMLWISNPSPSLVFALFVVALTSLFPLLFWDRVGHILLGHPAVLAADVVLGMAILGDTGVDTPFLYFTLQTVFLAALLYGVIGATIFSVLSSTVYWAGIALDVPLPDGPRTFHILVGVPLLHVLAAWIGVSVRRRLDMISNVEARARQVAETAATERERLRVAREMHDSLTKTLQGIALTAAAIRSLVHSDADAAAREAEELADTARAAVADARSMIADLRSDALDVPLGVAIGTFVREWASTSDIDGVTDASGDETLPPEIRWELLRIVKEALDNVARHSGASRASVSLRQIEGSVTLRIEDDGRGFDTRARRDVADRRFGITGMEERAAVIGGTLTVRSSAEGTVVEVTAPVAVAEQSA